MSKTCENVRTIIDFEDYMGAKDQYQHLFEVQVPPEDLHSFKPRMGFELGTPLVGDLVLDLEEEDHLEFHPFPEWVVQLRTKENVESKPYLILPELSRSFVRRLARKPLAKRVDMINEKIEDTSIDQLLAFEYEVGINVLVPPFIPHFFISSIIDKEAGKKAPYLQVFEPKIDDVVKALKIKPTYFVTLPFKVKI